MATLNCKQSPGWEKPRPTGNILPLQPVEEQDPHDRPDVCRAAAYPDCPLTQTLTQRYGSRWEGMNKYSKLTFRAVLSLYIFWSQWLAAAQPEALMAEAIEQINSDLHLDDGDVYDAIAQCSELPILDIEGILQGLNEQIQDECWSQDPSSYIP